MHGLKTEIDEEWFLAPISDYLFHSLRVIFLLFATHTVNAFATATYSRISGILLLLFYSSRIKSKVQSLIYNKTVFFS